jgi:hypothetical protein
MKHILLTAISTLILVGCNDPKVGSNSQNNGPLKVVIDDDSLNTLIDGNSKHNKETFNKALTQIAKMNPQSSLTKIEEKLAEFDSENKSQQKQLQILDQQLKLINKNLESVAKVAESINTNTKPAETKAGTVKWEYIMIKTLNYADQGKVYSIFPAGKEITPSGDLGSHAAIQNFYGDRGWELVSDDDAEWMSFKRPKKN